jgi:hypothetical protein
VRGRRLSELSVDLQIARERAYDLFNDLNSNDDFDVYCHAEGRTGTRLTETVCRAQFENRISARAASEYLEIFQLARENDEFAQAILDWDEANQQLEAARKRCND